MKIRLILIIWILSVSSCASSARLLLPLESRKLHIDIEKAVFYSTYTKCTGRFFKKCKLERIEYDYNDKAVRMKLKFVGFKLQVSR